MSNKTERTPETYHQNESGIESASFTGSLISSQTSDNLDDTISLNNQVNFVLKDYEKNEEETDSNLVSISSLPEFPSSMSSDLITEQVNERLKQIEETAKKGLSKYFEKNVLKFKIKLTFDEPVYLTDDIYLDELSVEDTESDLVSIGTTHTEVRDGGMNDNEDDINDTLVTYEVQDMERDEENKEDDEDRLSTHTLNNKTLSNNDLTDQSIISSKSTESNIKLGVFSVDKEINHLEHSVDESSRNKTNNNLDVMNKLSDLVDLFVSDDIEESVEVEYECVQVPVETDSDGLVKPCEDESLAVCVDLQSKETRPILGNVSFNNYNLLIPNNELVYTDNDDEENSDILSKELNGHRNLNIDKFQHLNLTELDNKQLNKLKLENFQHLTTTNNNATTSDNTNKTDAELEESVNVEYIEYTTESTFQPTTTTATTENFSSSKTESNRIDESDHQENAPETHSITNCSSNFEININKTEQLSFEINLECLDSTVDYFISGDQQNDSDDADSLPERDTNTEPTLISNVALNESKPVNKLNC